jgi:hypothetical protein
MLDYPWTATEVQSIVGSWPEDARPTNLHYYPSEYGYPAYWYHSNYDAMLDAHAAALHAMAGLVWLLDHCPVAVMLNRWHDGGVGVQFLANGDWHAGPTDLHAVSAAVRAVAGGSA